MVIATTFLYRGNANSGLLFLCVASTITLISWLHARITSTFGCVLKMIFKRAAVSVTNGNALAHFLTKNFLEFLLHFQQKSVSRDKKIHSTPLSTKLKLIGKITVQFTAMFVTYLKLIYQVILGILLTQFTHHFVVTAQDRLKILFSPLSYRLFHLNLIAVHANDVKNYNYISGDLSNCVNNRST